MNPVALFLLNVLLTCIECIALYLFSSCFFSCRYRNLKLFVSFCPLLAANILVYMLAQGIFIAKLIAITIVDAIWIKICFQANTAKSLITALFYYSFFLLGDGALLTGIAVITRQDIQVYSQTPYIYYLVCYVIKMIELAGIV